MTTLYAGLAIGSVYALIALTLNIPLTQAGIFNLAQGAFIALGLFIAFSGQVTRELPIPLIILGAAALCAVLAFAEDLVAIRPLGEDPHHNSLVTTVGFFTVVEGAIFLLWGSTPKSLPFFGGEQAFTLAGGRLVPGDVAIVAAAVLLALALHLVSTRTLWGLRGRATTEDPDAAKIRGINVVWIRVSALGLAAALGGALGVLIAPQTGVSNEITLRLVTYGFAALMIGGAGSYAGSLVGGLGVGVIEAMSGRYLGTEWAALMIFVLLMTILVVRPRGLLGPQQAREI